MHPRRCNLALISWLALIPLPSACAQDPYFPPSAFLPRDKEMNDAFDRRTSDQLEALKQESLWTLSKDDRKAQGFRLLWWASSEELVCIRIRRSGERGLLQVARGKQGAAAQSWELKSKRDIEITSAQWQSVRDEARNSKFWAAPAMIKERRGIADGDLILLEGVEEGKYRVMSRPGSATGESCKRLCRRILELADSAAVKAWDEFRDEDRKDPTYRAEPPQTEDLGDDEAGKRTPRPSRRERKAEE
jgi:hypothetical protein